jgi:subtilisin-like proprotein convertase family protein
MIRRVWVILGVVTLAVVALALALGVAQTGAAPAGNRLHDTVSCTTYYSSDTPLDIPDWDSEGVTSTITVDDQGTNLVTSIKVTLTISHTYDSDLSALLFDSEQISTTLFTHAGEGRANFVNTVLRNDAATSIYDGVAPFTGTFRPDIDFSTGMVANGEWGLHVVDTAEEDTGSIQEWSIELCTNGEVFPPHEPPGPGTAAWTPTRTPTPTPTMTPTPTPSGAYVPPGVYLFNELPYDLTNCASLVSEAHPTVAPNNPAWCFEYGCDENPLSCWRYNGCKNSVLICNMTDTPIECNVQAEGHAVDKRPNVAFQFVDWDLSDPGQSSYYLNGVTWSNPNICNTSNFSDDHNFTILPERMDEGNEYNAALIENWAAIYGSECGGAATVSSSLSIRCAPLPISTPSRTPTRTATPTRTPRPPKNLEATAAAQPYLSEIYPCQAATPIDWNLRSGVGNNDLYIEIAGTPGVRVSNYQVGLMNGSATPMWERQLSNDYTIVGAMVSFADEMYAWAPSPTPTRTPTATTTPPATGTAGPSPTATTTLTPVPTWTPGPWPTAGIAYLADASGRQISTRVFDASGECGSTPVAYQPVGGNWIWSTPGPGRVPGAAVRGLVIESGAGSGERDASGGVWPLAIVGAAGAAGAVWWWRRRKR